VRNAALAQHQGKYEGHLNIKAGNQSANQDTTAGTVADAQTHLVYTRDNNGTARMYINGQAVTPSNPQSVNGDFDNWDANALLVLGNELAGGHAWLGEIYLVAIYNRALSQDDVATNYRAML
jgi:hypothetical protein